MDDTELDTDRLYLIFGGHIFFQTLRTAVQLDLFTLLAKDGPLTRQEIAKIMGVQVQPRFFHVARWPRSMAQYTVGHHDRVRRIEQRIAGAPGLHVAGNAYYGIGIPDCVKMGREAASRIAASAGR